MHIQITDEQMRDMAAHILPRSAELNQNLPGMHLNPSFVSCNGEQLRIELSYHTEPWMSNPMGKVHGGVIAILLDNSMGILCSCLCHGGTPTISMTLNYPRPVPLNATVHTRAHMVVFGRTSSQLTAELFLPEDPDRVLAYATGVSSTREPRDLTQPKR